VCPATTCGEQADISRATSDYKLLLQPVMLGLNQVNLGPGQGLGLEAQVLGLGVAVLCMALCSALHGNNGCV